MPSFKKEGGRIIQASQNLGDRAYDAFANLFKSSSNAAEANFERNLARTEARALAKETADEIAKPLREAAEEAARKAKLERPIATGIKNGVGGLLKFGWRIVEVPTTVVVLKPAKYILNGGAAPFEHFPKAAPVGVVLAGAAAGGSWLANRNSQNLQAQSDMLAQMQMAQAQPMQSYMNSASQADVDARIAYDRANGVAGAAGSRADAVMAARQQTPAPETANIAAL